LQKKCEQEEEKEGLWFNLGANVVVLLLDATPYSFCLSLSVHHLRDRRIRSLAARTTIGSRPV
jgi:hypothetical protein